MTMTLWQVRDRLRAVDSNGMSGDVCDELADAIDAWNRRTPPPSTPEQPE